MIGAGTVHHQYPVHVFSPFQQLFHVQLNLAWGELDPLILQQPSKVVIHVREDHINGERCFLPTT